MSLTVPDIYKSSSINENWVAQLTHDNNTCLSFDGVNDRVNFGNILGTYSTYTLEAWINPDTVDIVEKAYIIFRGNQDYDEDTEANNVSWSLYQSDNDVGFYYQYDASTTTRVTYANNVLTVGTWTHLALVRDNSDNSVKLYVNGSLKNSTTSTPDPTGGGSGNVYIGYGQYNSSAVKYFKGKIAHVRVWNVARTEDQIGKTMNSNIIGTESGLQGYWKLNEGSGTSVDDVTSNNNNGTVSGASWDQVSFTEFIKDIGLSFADTTIDDTFYHGAIVNKGIKIRDSIDLAKSSAKTSNITLTVADFMIRGSKFYKQVINGTYNYINKDVRIFSQPARASSLSSCIQIYNGRLTGVSLNEFGIVSLSLTSKRPWDFISIPNTKSSTNNVYFPVAYGNYTPETSTDSSPQFCDDAVTIGSDYSGAIVHPIPQDIVAGNNIKFLMHEDTETDGTSSDARAHYYERNYDIFVPMDPADNTADSYGGGGAINVPISLLREFKTRDYDIASTTTFSDTEYLKTDTSDYATAQLQVTNGSSNTTLADDEYIYLDFKKPDGKITNLNIQFDYILDRGAIALGGSPSTKYIKIIDDSAGNDDTLSTLTISNTHTDPFTGSINADLENPNTIGQIKLHFKMRLDDTSVTTNFATYDVSVKNIVLTVKCELDRSGEPDAFSKVLADLKEVYTGSDGFDKSYSGGSGNVQGGLAAHRDMLARYTGYDVVDADLYNWSSNLDVKTLRSGWNIRWWALEPVDLKNVLAEIQKEFGFIFKWRPDGSGSYWAVKDSYSASDVVATLKSADIKNLSVNHTPFSNLLTKMTINYNYHPAKESYLSTITSEDSTNGVRSKYNIRDKENIKEVNLKMNVDKPGNADVGAGGSNPNDGYADYYMNIFGDVKKIISCEVVNAAKGYALETGDIIQFSNSTGEMPVTAFNDNWSNYYMVTDLTRGIGSVKITCREVK